MMANKPNSGASLGPAGRHVLPGLAHAPAIDELLQREVVAQAVAPGAVAAVARRGVAGWYGRYGCAGYLDQGGLAPTDYDTPYDLASLTKSVVAVVAARLIDRGLLSPTHPLQAFAPELARTLGGSATFEQLMAHRAGLVAHLPLFEPLTRGNNIDPHRALLACANAAGPLALNASDGFPCVYSDLGYILLGHGLEEAASPGCPPFSALDTLVARELSSLELPSILSARQWRDAVGAETFTARVARTEEVKYRGGTLAGVVHDDNAWALAGLGTAGHAGLFAPVQSVANFGAFLLDERARRGRALSEETRNVLFSPRPGGGHLAGFDTKSGGRDSLVGARCGGETFGHLGFTGTSLWCDPATDTVLVLLSNRVNPSRDNRNIRFCRPRINDALYQIADATSFLPPADTRSG